MIPSKLEDFNSMGVPHDKLSQGLLIQIIIIGNFHFTIILLQNFIYPICGMGNGFILTINITIKLGLSSQTLALRQDINSYQKMNKQQKELNLN